MHTIARNSVMCMWGNRHETISIHAKLFNNKSFADDINLMKIQTTILLNKASPFIYIRSMFVLKDDSVFLATVLILKILYFKIIIY